MKQHIAISVAILLVACACSKSNDHATKLPEYMHVQMVNLVTNQPMPAFRMDTYQKKVDIFNQTPEVFYGMLITDASGYITLPYGYTYRLVPKVDTIWAPNELLDPNFYDTTVEKRSYLLPLTELILHHVPDDSVLLDIQTSLPDSLLKPGLRGTLYDSFRTDNLETVTVPLTTGVNNTVRVSATLKDGTVKLVNYQIHPTDHQPIHINLPF